MTYCAERTKLLAEAGRDLATKLLPEPFKLWHSDHSTGIQMTIVVQEPCATPLYVWRGSVWHSSIYEFNDRDAIAGLQPDFAFAREVIEKYFADVWQAVQERDAARAVLAAARAAEAAAARQLAIDAVKEKIGARPMVAEHGMEGE